MKQVQRGFTLIELVMVIVILGILAAVALPKFTNMSTDAHNAVRKGLAGAINSACAIDYAQSQITGHTALIGATPTLASALAQVNVTGIDAADKAAVSAIAFVAGPPCTATAVSL